MVVFSVILATLVLQAPAPTRADTTPPAAAIETPYTIRSGTLGLAATLTMPRDVAAPVPVAIIIAG